MSKDAKNLIKVAKEALIALKTARENESGFGQSIYTQTINKLEQAIKNAE